MNIVLHDKSADEATGSTASEWKNGDITDDKILASMTNSHLNDGKDVNTDDNDMLLKWIEWWKNDPSKEKELKILEQIKTWQDSNASLADLLGKANKNNADENTSLEAWPWKKNNEEESGEHRKPMQFRDGMLNVEGIDRGLGKPKLSNAKAFAKSGNIDDKLVDSPLFI